MVLLKVIVVININNPIRIELSNKISKFCKTYLYTLFLDQIQGQHTSSKYMKMTFEFKGILNVQKLYHEKMEDYSASFELSKLCILLVLS